MTCKCGGGEGEGEGGNRFQDPFMSFLGQQSTQCSINSISDACFTGCSQPVPSILIAGALLYTSDKVIMYVIDSHHSYNMLTLCLSFTHMYTIYQCM